MYRRARILALVAVAAVMSMGTAPVGSQQAGLPAGMLGVEWRLEAIRAAGQPDENLANAGITLTFAADGTVSGSGGCNRYFGGYTGDEQGNLRIGELGSTLILCAPPVSEIEARYFAALTEVRGYELVDPARLHLRLDPPGRMLVYSRTPGTMPATGGGGMGGASLGGSTTASRR